MSFDNKNVNSWSRATVSIQYTGSINIDKEGIIRNKIETILSI